MPAKVTLSLKELDELKIPVSHVIRSHRNAEPIVVMSMKKKKQKNLATFKGLLESS